MSEYRDYAYVLNILSTGTREQLEGLEQLVDGFPQGVDPFIGRRWIINAIDTGSVRAVEWMLSRGVDLAFRDEEGYTPLHSAIDRRGPIRLEMLEQLLRAGAPVNLKGINDWTPAHMAAARDDVDALRLLVRFGADLSMRTEIDDYATPLEEARTLRCRKAVNYLKSVS